MRINVASQAVEVTPTASDLQKTKPLGPKNDDKANINGFFFVFVFLNGS